MCTQLIVLCCKAVLCNISAHLSESPASAQMHDCTYQDAMSTMHVSIYSTIGAVWSPTIAKGHFHAPV